jgi:signal transduction histidine kinase
VTRSRLLADGAIATVAFAASLALVSHGGLGTGERDGVDLGAGAVALIACSSLPLAAWRRSPAGVLVVTTAASALLAGLGYRVGLPVGPAVALFLLALTREAWDARATALVLGLFAAWLGAAAIGGGGFPGSELLHGGLAFALAWFAGDRMRLHHERLERDRLLAVAEERARIARDLHDSAGQAINVIAVRAGAARLRHDEDPERSRRALAAIEEVARDTAAEIDRIVGSLRRGADVEASEGAGNGVEAPHGLASLGALVTRHEATGLDLAVRTSGAPRPLPAAVDQAAYRILQEAIGNAARHGTGTAAVEVAFADRELRLTVTNPVGSEAPAPRRNGGHGVIGMTERAVLLGGRLDAGRVNGSFRVAAELPYS